VKTLPHLSSQITVCTDDVPPDMLLEKGGIIALLNLLIEHGSPATDVLRFATSTPPFACSVTIRADCRRAPRRSGGV
jgi:adenine deaminase